jgi:hypothetical protein
MYDVDVVVRFLWLPNQLWSVFVLRMAHVKYSDLNAHLVVVVGMVVVCITLVTVISEVVLDLLVMV